MNAPSIRRVLVTGANGNLGRKLIAALLASDRYETVLGVDIAHPAAKNDDARLVRVVADLARRDAARWLEAMRRADAVVHLAAQNPRMAASWADAAASFDMTANLVAQAGNIRRFVFASSNHVMGGYKETAIAHSDGALKTDLPPLTGTRSRIAGEEMTSTAYATAKLMGERLLVANASREGFTAVSLRIGWVQPDENRPETISASGTSDRGPGEESAESAHTLRWFRNMWLSNDDFLGFVQAALHADASGWPAPAIVVNAMSANRGMPWDLAAGRDYLGFTPKDDLWSVVNSA
jgi:nucleoside-diphosphate-sugar epimerase